MIDIEKEILDAFKQSITRFRWFVLTSILIAATLLAHVYLESGFTMTQLKGFALEQKLSNKLQDLEARTASLKGTYPDTVQLGDGPTPEALGKSEDALHLAEEWQVFLRHKNLLDNYAVSDRKLPLLGYDVPGNDFLPVMAMMLLIFSIATWLGSRSVLASIEHIRAFKTKALMNLFRLHFMFTVPTEGKHGMANIVQYAAVWLPTLVLGTASTMDLVPAFTKYFANPGMLTLPIEALILRLVLLFSLFGGVLASTVAVSFTIARINESSEVEEAA